jgi:hypothetical protein
LDGIRFALRALPLTPFLLKSIADKMAHCRKTTGGMEKKRDPCFLQAMESLADDVANGPADD